jgi:hypothetical protein
LLLGCLLHQLGHLLLLLGCLLHQLGHLLLELPILPLQLGDQPLSMRQLRFELRNALIAGIRLVLTFLTSGLPVVCHTVPILHPTPVPVCDTHY